jgi:hypothetical protein
MEASIPYTVDKGEKLVTETFGPNNIRSRYAGASNVEPADLIAERRYPHRVGQTYQLRYSPKHRWFYFPEMRATRR